MTTNHTGKDTPNCPSYFPSLQSKMSTPITQSQQIEKLITSDTTIKGYTEAYRKRLVISKKYADELKPLTPGIAMAVAFDGKGRNTDNITGETRFLSIDIDGLTEQELEIAFHKALLASYSCAVYRTISGHGFRIFARYERPEGCDLSMVELYAIILQKAITFYEMLLGVKADEKCTDFTRLSGLAHDPNAYFNWDAEPIRLTGAELEAARKPDKPTAPKRSYTRRASTSKTQPSTNAPKVFPVPTMAEAASHIEHLMEIWGQKFESGNHNSYVNRFAWTCVLYGIKEKEVNDYASEHFSSDYPEAFHVIKSCYKHGKSKNGSWTFYPKDAEFPTRPTIRRIKQWLSSHYEFRHNTMTSQIEIKSLVVENAKYIRWTNIDDTIKNSIWVEINETGMEVAAKKLEAIIDSDFCEDYDPLEQYLRNLRPWDGKHDYIAELAKRITVENRPEYKHDQETFIYFFKKWFVAMVVAWVTPSVVNQTMLILVGKGGIYKTTFFNYLLPAILRPYYLNDSTANYLDKDFMEAFSSKALICLDEFETASGKNLSAFKSNVTKQKFSIRRPYDKFRTELSHRGSLSATSNTVQMIPDEENRRFSPWIVKRIVSPIDHPIDYDNIYAQAVALGQQVREDKKNGVKDGWVYWLTAEDIQTMKDHNKLFMVANFAEEQINRFYSVPDMDRAMSYGQSLKFRYNAEIMERICTNPVMRQNMSKQSIGSIMARLGFPRAHRKRGNGWWVVEKEGVEINTNSLYSMADEDSARQ